VIAVAAFAENFESPIDLGKGGNRQSCQRDSVPDGV